MKGWLGYYNKLAGYARAADAMGALYRHCVSLGVRFELGDAAAKLLYSNSGCIGAETDSGKYYQAATTIVALGAYAASVLPDLATHMKALGVPVAHVLVTPEEAVKLKGLPVTYARDLGFLFEPDPETNLIKLCPATGGYTNYGKSERGSLPPQLPDNYLFMPEEEETRLRQLLRETLPSLADRPFLDKKFCWFMDTTDHDYVIDYVPGVEGLIVCSGDSGHGYKMLPVFGEWVLKVLEAKEQTIARWKWKKDDKPLVHLRIKESQDLSDFVSHTPSANL